MITGDAFFLNIIDKMVQELSFNINTEAYTLPSPIATGHFQKRSYTWDLTMRRVMYGCSFPILADIMDNTMLFTHRPKQTNRNSVGNDNNNKDKWFLIVRLQENSPLEVEI